MADVLELSENSREFYQEEYKQLRSEVIGLLGRIELLFRYSMVVGASVFAWLVSNSMGVTGTSVAICLKLPTMLLWFGWLNPPAFVLCAGLMASTTNTRITEIGGYLLGILSYWLNDESEDFTQTTQLIDLSLGLGVLVLGSGLITKALALGGFMLRSQAARYFAPGAKGLDALIAVRQAFGESAPIASKPARAGRSSKPDQDATARPPGRNVKPKVKS